MKNKKVMILIVAYNAEKTIKKLLDRFPKEVWKTAKEVVLADDASKDDTFEVALNYKNKNKKKNLTVIKHEKNKGYGGNQKWGYDYAMRKNYDIVAMVHGDVQYPPEYIIPLIKPLINESADFVFGSRMSGNPLRGGMPFYKYFGNIFLTTVENVFLGTNLSEFHSGFRAYSVRTLKQIPFFLNSNDFHFDSQIIFQLVKARKRIEEITIPTFYGDEKCNVRVVPYGLNILKELLKFKAHALGIKYYKNYDIRT